MAVKKKSVSSSYKSEFFIYPSGISQSWLLKLLSLNCLVFLFFIYVLVCYKVLINILLFFSIPIDMNYISTESEKNLCCVPEKSNPFIIFYLISVVNNTSLTLIKE